MLQAGQFHTLTVIDQQPQGLYLDDGFDGRILLPNRHIPDGTQVGDSLKVFVYLDSDDRPIATCQRPRLQLHQVGYLQVADVNRTGAFLDWGLAKDLFVPFAEQLQRMEAGQSYAVYLTEDNTGRLIGSARLNRFIKDQITDTDSVWQQQASATPELKAGDAVKMLIVQQTDLGYKAVINHRWWGLIHQSDVRTAIRPGLKLDGYIKRVREDGRIDLGLEPPGHRRAAPLASRIMTKLQANGGSLGLSDRSPAELIEMHFGVSKRVFKMAIGQLYKERKIRIEPDAIHLADPNQKEHKPRSNNKRHQHDKPRNAKSATPKQTSSKQAAASSDESKAADKPANKKVWKNNRAKTSRTLSLKRK